MNKQQHGQSARMEALYRSLPPEGSQEVWTSLKRPQTPPHTGTSSHIVRVKIKSPTERVNAVRRQTAGVESERGDGGGVTESGGQLAESAHFLCELRVAGNVQHTEGVESRHDST